METFDDLEEREVTMSEAQFRALIDLYKLYAAEVSDGCRP